MSVIVAGEATLRWSVELPKDKQHEGQMCDDPAVEAVLSAFPQQSEVFLWGLKVEGAKVFIECHEDDVIVEEDARLE